MPLWRFCNNNNLISGWMLIILLVFHVIQTFVFSLKTYLFVRGDRTLLSDRALTQTNTHSVLNTQLLWPHLNGLHVSEWQRGGNLPADRWTVRYARWGCDLLIFKVTTPFVFFLDSSLKKKSFRKRRGTFWLFGLKLFRDQSFSKVHILNLKSLKLSWQFTFKGTLSFRKFTQNTN